jgi:hypothetical protein
MGVWRLLVGNGKLDIVIFKLFLFKKNLINDKAINPMDLSFIVKF